MRSSWPRVTLGDHVELLTGFPFKSAQFSSDPRDIRLVKGVNVGQGDLRWDRTDYWPVTERSEYGKYELGVGDVILAMDRPWVEAGLKQAVVTERDLPALLLQRVARLRGAYGLATGFLRYLISSRAFSNYIQPIVTGVNVPHISPDQIRGFTFHLPPEPVQHRAAAVLGAYDELIENNLRRIEILEEMAQAVYREWFVNFRFPGHEDVDLVDSPLGPIPEGWRIERIADLCDRIQAGSTPRRSKPEYWSECGVPWYKTGELHDTFLLGSKEHVTELAETRIFDPGTILMAIYGSPTVGRMGIVVDASSANQAALGLVPRSDVLGSILLYYLLLGKREYFNSIAQGAAQQNISKTKVETTVVLVPDRFIATSFEETVRPIWDLKLNLSRLNANLRTTRDLLLPRLVSGQIDVSEMDIDTAWLAS